MRVYDGRHAYATTWLRGGVPLETARWLGHSVETRVSIDVEAIRAFAGDDIDAAVLYPDD